MDPSKDKEGNIAQIIDDLENLLHGRRHVFHYYFKELNVTKLIYNYYWVDLVQAANPANGFRLNYSGGNADPVVTYGRNCHQAQTATQGRGKHRALVLCE
jgi:hypothetical protein